MPIAKYYKLHSRCGRCFCMQSDGKCTFKDVTCSMSFGSVGFLGMDRNFRFVHFDKLPVAVVRVEDSSAEMQGTMTIQNKRSNPAGSNFFIT